MSNRLIARYPEAVMAVSPGSTNTQPFATLPEPRTDYTNRHHLLDLLTIASVAILSGANAWGAVCP